MSVGPIIVALGMLLLTRVDAGSTYVTSVLPAVIVFGLGLTCTVAPLTATALAAVDDRHAGVASGVNTTVARAAQLAAVAALPALAGLTGDSYRDPAEFSEGFDTAMLITAVIAAAGGILAALVVRNPEPEPTPVPEPERVPALASGEAVHAWFCGVEGPPPRPNCEPVAR
jgi:hypothetical protein